LKFGFLNYGSSSKSHERFWNEREKIKQVTGRR